jgi:hypothetical protein
MWTFNLALALAAWVCAVSALNTLAGCVGNKPVAVHVIGHDEGAGYR